MASDIDLEMKELITNILALIDRTNEVPKTLEQVVLHIMSQLNVPYDTLEDKIDTQKDGALVEYLKKVAGFLKEFSEQGESADEMLE